MLIASLGVPTIPPQGPLSDLLRGGDIHNVRVPCHYLRLPAEHQTVQISPGPINQKFINGEIRLIVPYTYNFIYTLVRRYLRKFLLIYISYSLKTVKKCVQRELSERVLFQLFSIEAVLTDPTRHALSALAVFYLMKLRILVSHTVPFLT